MNPAPSVISIVIPVYNERRNIVRAYDAIVAEFSKIDGKYRYEILFSDNHSDDGTDIELATLAARDPNVKVIRLARNFGFQRSVLTAYRHVSGAAAIQLDCDLQDPPELIHEFIKKWEEGFDVVVGIRRSRPEGRILQYGRRLFYKLVTAISNDNILENAGDFRLLDRSVIDRLSLVNDMQPYTRGLVSSLAVRQTGIVYDRHARQFEKSKFPLWKLTEFATDGIVNHSLLPLRLASFVGVIVSLVAFGTLLYYLIAYLVARTDWPPGFATLTIILLFSIGMNAIFMGIIGEYVGRIYTQVRAGPLTIIERKINFDSERDKK